MKEKLKAMFAVSSDDSSEENQKQKSEVPKAEKGLPQSRRGSQRKGNSKSSKREKREASSPARVYTPRVRSESAPMPLKEERPLKSILKGSSKSRKSGTKIKDSSDREPSAKNLKLSKSGTSIVSFSREMPKAVAQKNKSDHQLVEVRKEVGEDEEVISAAERRREECQKVVQEDSNENARELKKDDIEEVNDFQIDITNIDPITDDELTYNYEKELEHLTNERQKITETMNILEDKISRIIFNDDDINGVAGDSPSAKDEDEKSSPGDGDDGGEQRCPDTEYLQRLHQIVDHNTEESRNCTKECYQGYLNKRVDLLKEKIITLKDSLDECKSWIREEMESINQEMEKKVAEPPSEIQVYHQTAVEVTEIREFTSNQRATSKYGHVRVRDLSCGDSESTQSGRPRKHDWELERLRARRDYAAAHYMHKLFEVDLLCQQEMAKLEQNVSRLVPLSTIASEWEDPSLKPNEVGDAGRMVRLKDSHSP